MILAGLLPLIENMHDLQHLVAALRTSSWNCLRVAVIDAAKPALLACLQQGLDRPMLCITTSGQRAQQVYDQLSAWSVSPDLIHLYPAPDTLFYERIPADVNGLRQRLRSMAALAQHYGPLTNVSPPENSPIVVASAKGLMQRITPPHRFASDTPVLRQGQSLNPADMLRHWLTIGYSPATMVEEPGTFSRRGGIIDIFPLTNTEPVRIELFGENIESIRLFDPATQRSLVKVSSVLITPTLSVPSQKDRSGFEALLKLDLSRCHSEVQEEWRRDLERLERGESFAGIEFYAPYYTEATILDYLPANGLLVLDEPEGVQTAIQDLEQQATELRHELIRSGQLPSDYAVPYLGWEELSTKLRQGERVLSFAWHGDQFCGEDNLWDLRESFQNVIGYGGSLNLVMDDCRKALQDRNRVVLVTQQSKRLAELFREEELFVTSVEQIEQAPQPGTLNIVHGLVGGGFQVPDSREGLILLTDSEMFGWSKPRRAVRRRAALEATVLSDLEIGDFVVHIEHGIARYQGLTKLTSNGVEREYLLLEYAEGDRLYVPTDHSDRVSRYIGAGESLPVLHRLGSLEWMRTKERARTAVKNVAKELLELYAAREVKQGYAFAPDSPWQGELEASFPYLETPDQAQVIAEVKMDMEKSKPMDRLICGDVGYGKTEVALRAAFKAVIDGKQVAILVPTTVLAQQHFNTFRERLQPFPVRLEMLSRFRSAGEQREILQGLRLGTIDICVGTHRLIQKDVVFRDLGLVIIDEEQRFGVVHKERLKQLRKEVDVLTLTATPIPRTLHIALTGIRDMSTIETAPEDRLPIKTYVLVYDERVIREGILRELERGGQVYFVHNRVQSIYAIAEHLRRLVPEARIAIGHGQMLEEQLEKVMLDFAAGRYDVLVCSTIIESGLDIPNVNTIFVNEAYRFGLAQLYQLRGRVGRGASRAYAYFLFDRDRKLTPTAEKRLRTIFEATELGAGFRIAMKDLEIRGAGNMLGVEQHGHIAAVGFNLYCRLLAEAVRELQGKEEKELPAITLDLPLSAYLPADYIEDELQRLNLYQRLAGMGSIDRLGHIVTEVHDRFGPLPPPALNLIYLLQLRLWAAFVGIESISSVGKEIIIHLNRETKPEWRSLLQHFGNVLKIGHRQIRLSYQLASAHPPSGHLGGSGYKWMDTLQQLLESLAEGSMGTTHVAAEEYK
ncbi:MAG: transcription-repair coupling factor [Chloroflexi bacterium]|nr:transcription-repair coupling factor [Chloroflexota bacterium]MCL5076083.1 transcription-repair coupling factor [Chloroflexota bacterium]